MSEECKEKFTDLFKKDHTPSSALAQYKSNDIQTIMADRSILADYFWVFHYHSTYMENMFGSVNGPDALQRVKQRADDYNDRNGMVVAKMEEASNGGVIVAICDKFCRRVQENVPQARDIMPVDATSNLNRHETKLVHLVCPTPAGGLPLGNILTSKEDETTIDASFPLFISIVGPKIIMTDDCGVEKKH